MIGCGSMGGGMAQLFAENGMDVSLSDPDDKAINYLLEQAEKSGVGNKLHKHKGRIRNLRARV
jgi:6-phosphogluconate dehydrogenase